MKHIEQRVTEEEDGIRLDRWLRRHYPQLAQGALQKALRKGDIRLDGKRTEAAARIQAGQTVRIFHAVVEPSTHTPPPKTPRRLPPAEANKIRDWVIFENDQAIAINKPAGLAVQGGSGQTKHIDAMLDALAAESGQRPKLVHRLDRDTSGVLLLAKSAKAADRLTKAFAGKQVEKIYWALVKGVPEIAQGEINLPLTKAEHGKDSRIEKMGASEDGKPAITRYRIIERLAKQLAWVELLPLTGRTHQLRVHMAEIGHPIIGDGKYGGREAFIEGMELPRQLHLHAHRIALPDCGIDVSAPLPPHMKTSWQLLGLEA